MSDEQVACRNVTTESPHVGTEVAASEHVGMGDECGKRSVHEFRRTAHHTVGDVSRFSVVLLPAPSDRSIVWVYAEFCIREYFFFGIVCREGAQRRMNRWIADRRNLNALLNRGDMKLQLPIVFDVCVLFALQSQQGCISSGGL